LIPGMNAHPSYVPAPACQALSCTWRSFLIDVCREERCPHRWQREAVEDRARSRETTANTSEVTSKWNTLATNSEDRKG